MLTFLARRLLASVAVVLIASYVVYVLTCYSGDPLADLRLSRRPGTQVLIAERTAALHLDVTPWLRYFLWLKGILAGFVGHLDLGMSSGGRPVSGALVSAAEATFQLLIGATIIAIVVGVSLGVLSALRQYTAFDYATTLQAFVFYSLPIFWLAVILKEYLAIGFNNFLGHPVLGVIPTFLVSVAVGAIVCSAARPGPSRWKVFLGATGLVAVVITIVSLTHWLDNPQLTVVGVALLSVGLAFGVAYGLAGKANKRALYTALTVVGIGLLLYFPLQYSLFTFMSLPLLILLGLVAVGVGALTGHLWGGPDRGSSRQVGALVAFLTSGLIALDRFMQDWQTYAQSGYVNGRPIATIGATTPNFDGDFWFTGIDHFTHLLLPTAALTLASLAGYSRYARASLLDVMGQDYIRTARSKGLTERAVVVRHALRNALIPVVTIVTLDLGALIGGTIVTENVFSYQGMGALLINAIQKVDPNTVMGCFLVTGAWAILFNLIADLLYSALDPRIRVHS